MPPILATYYGREVDVSLYQGWRGFLVKLYARAITWLQRKLEWHLLHLVAAEQQLPAAQVEELEHKFENDYAATARKVVRDLLKGSEQPVTRADRYRDQGLRSEKPREPSFAPYIAPGRSKRYARARTAKLADREGDVIAALPPARYGMPGGDDHDAG
jgi:hypothetical protein